MTKQHPQTTPHRTTRRSKKSIRPETPPSSPDAPASPPGASPPASTAPVPSQQLARVGSPSGAGRERRAAQALVLSNLAERAEQAAGFAAASRAPRTLETYRARWRGFEAWCSAHQLCPLPCSPQTLILWATDEAERGINPRSLGVAIAAIAWAHTNAGVERAQHPHRNPLAAEVLAGIRRSKGTPPRRVKPLVVGELRQVAEQLSSTRLIEVRNRALLAVGFAAATRRSELVELDVADVQFCAEGVRLTIKRSKTDQTAQGVVLALPFNRTEAVCPSRALKAWLEASGIESGPLFRSMTRHGGVKNRRMGGRDVARIIQQGVQAAGLDPSQYSGHSLRAGLATSAAQAGKTDRAIMTQGRWSGRAMLDRYIREAKLFGQHNAADGL